MMLADIVVDRKQLFGAVRDDSEQQQRRKDGALDAFLGLWLGKRSERSGPAKTRSLRWVGRTGGQRSRSGAEEIVVVHAAKTRPGEAHGGIHLVTANHHRGLRASGVIDQRAVIAEILEHFPAALVRSEEHTSELQSHLNLVCRLLLEKKKKNQAPLCSVSTL